MIHFPFIYFQAIILLQSYYLMPLEIWYYASLPKLEFIMETFPDLS